MSTIPLSTSLTASAHLRPLNILRDLPQVADLLELCFSNTFDNDDKNYMREMRRASRDEPWLRWASAAMDGASMPLTGYVWEQDGRIVGNASLIVFRHHKRKLYMLSNIAVHPDHRHRGIARVLTERGMAHARQRNADELWLHVRDDNADALDLYNDLGFRERARRTTWMSTPDPLPELPADNIEIQPRHKRFWARQLAWLKKLHPDELAWYRHWNFEVLAPGWWNWFYLFFVDFNLRQWSALREGTLHALLSWTPNGLRQETLWLALGEDSALEAVTRLLVRARGEIGKRRLQLEHPVGRADESIRAAGFVPRRTLVWMSAPGATKASGLRRLFM